MVPCEILFRDIKSVDLDTFQNDLIRSKLLDTPFLSSSSYNRKKNLKITSAKLNYILLNLSAKIKHCNPKSRLLQPFIKKIFTSVYSKDCVSVKDLTFQLI